MKGKITLLVSTLLVLGVFLVHVGTMRPTRAERCMAEALDYLLEQREQPEEIDRLLPKLSGGAYVRTLSALPQQDKGLTPIGDRMLEDGEKLYYIRPGSGGVVEFRLSGADTEDSQLLLLTVRRGY